LAASPFAEAIEAIRKPLLFAARDDFQHLARVRDLGPTALAAVDRALALAIPRDAREALRAVRDAFAEPPAGDALRDAIQRALARTHPLAAAGFAEAALARPVSVLPGIGPKRAQELSRRGLSHVSDLLFHLPTRYEDRRSLVPLGEVEVGRRATVRGRVLACDAMPMRRRFRRGFQAVIDDGTGTLVLVWFRGAEAMPGRIRKGALLLASGDVRRYRFSKQIVHPEVEILAEDGAGEPPQALLRLVPVYPGVEGLPPRSLRRLVLSAVAEYADLVPGYLPERAARERGLPPVSAALRALHAPEGEAPAPVAPGGRDPARERLVLEELYLLELGLALSRAQRAREPGIEVPGAARLAAPAARALPFRLTQAQRRALGEVLADLERPHPMNRLLQGDVGSGKTAVAFLAALAAARAGFQSALMAPTELLAEQHARTLERLVASGGDATSLRRGLLTASVARAEAEATREVLAAGEIDLVIGTHALVQEDVRFAGLALAITDEQHRFGVLQRKALASKTRSGVAPHVLVMTATPIPRTLALTLYGDLDVSVIDELPPGRKPVVTDLLRPGEGRRIVDLIRDTCARGEQAYVVYPLVEESEKSDLRAATESAERIRRAFPALRVDLVHGRQPARVRADAMARFERGETQVLVATTVVEVGVDVPNATLMVIEHAERFGLAQLHQLRGRVGRGRRPGTCLLVARHSSEDGEARLRAMLETSDGFEIADADLRIRGPGEFLGTRQSGHLPDLRLADLARDARLLSAAREWARETVAADPGLRRAPDLLHAVASRWGGRLSLVAVG
jgi:ATP-dependent DNA helicase RecG